MLFRSNYLISYSLGISIPMSMIWACRRELWGCGEGDPRFQGKGVPEAREQEGARRVGSEGVRGGQRASRARGQAAQGLRVGVGFS